MTDEEPIVPLFAYPQAGPRFVMKEVCATLGDTGVQYPAAHARIKSYTKNRLIHVRKEAQATRPNEYEFSELGAAIILSALQDIGIQDHEVLQAASMAIYGWSALPAAQRRDEKYRLSGGHLPRHPIDRAIVGTMSGEVWNFFLDVRRDSQTGARILNCDLVQFGDDVIGHHESPPMVIPVSTVAVTLNTMFAPVHRRMMPSREN